VHNDDHLDAAIAALSEPERLREAQDLVARAAPSLGRVLNAALEEGGWFDDAHRQAVRDATSSAEPEVAVHSLIADELRVGMLVGVAVGFELARELSKTKED
jgi:hypothetical protein